MTIVPIYQTCTSLKHCCYRTLIKWYAIYRTELLNFVECQNHFKSNIYENTAYYLRQNFVERYRAYMAIMLNFICTYLPQALTESSYR